MLVNIIVGLVGLLNGLFVSVWPESWGWEVSQVFSSLSSFILSFLLWRYLIIKRNSESILVGIIVGLFIVIFSTYLVWYLAFCSHYICSFFSPKYIYLSEEFPPNPVRSIYFAIGTTLISFVMFPITLPIGGLIGAIGILVQNKARS